MKDEKPNLSMLKKINRSIKDWAFTDFHVPTFVIGTGFTSELVSQISSEYSEVEVYLADKNRTSLSADLLIIGGIINKKSMGLIKKEYKKLTGKKYVVVIGNETINCLKNNYFNVDDIEEQIYIDLIIPGNPPSRADIQNGLNLLKSVR